MKKCEIGPATLYCGNCLSLLEKGVLQADAVVSDPPYGIGFLLGEGSGKTGFPDRKKSKPIHGDDAPFDPAPWLSYPKVVFLGANHFASRLPCDKQGDWLVWDKSCGLGPNSSFRDAEFAWSSVRTPRTIFRWLWLGCLKQNGEAKTRQRLHVSEKPVELMAWLMEQARVGLGKTVLDPYMGSGSTGVACLMTGRKFIGVEIDRENFSIAKKRLEQAWAKIEALNMQAILNIFKPENQQYQTYE